MNEASPAFRRRSAGMFGDSRASCPRRQLLLVGRWPLAETFLEFVQTTGALAALRDRCAFRAPLPALRSAATNLPQLTAAGWLS